MKDITFSIVTPSYNQGQFIDYTIQSILRQEGDFYIDYIVMDGNSTDETMKIVEDYARQIKEKSYPIKCKGITMRYQSKKDKGQADAINKGFALAKGDIYAWLNSDDVYVNPYTLKKVAGLFEDKNVNFVYGRGVDIQRDGQIIRETPFVTEGRMDLLKEMDYVLQPSSFWRSSVWKKTGLLNIKMHYAFDWDYWVRIAKNFQFTFYDDILSANRLYPENKTLGTGFEREKEIIHFLIRIDALTERSVQHYIVGQGRTVAEAFQQTLRYKLAEILFQPIANLKHFLLRPYARKIFKKTVKSEGGWFEFLHYYWEKKK